MKIVNLLMINGIVKIVTSRTMVTSVKIAVIAERESSTYVIVSIVLFPLASKNVSIVSSVILVMGLPMASISEIVVNQRFAMTVGIVRIVFCALISETNNIVLVISSLQKSSL